MPRGLKFLFLTLLLYCWTGPVWADYTLVLKNGRRITVQSYREEGRMIKFHDLDGEIGISKDQIQSIEKTVQVLPPQQTQLQGPAAGPQAAERPLTPEEEKVREEKEYQQKLMEVTGQLKEVQDRYSQLLRGTTSPEPSPCPVLQKACTSKMCVFPTRAMGKERERFSRTSIST